MDFRSFVEKECIKLFLKNFVNRKLMSFLLTENHQRNSFYPCKFEEYANLMKFSIKNIKFVSLKRYAIKF